MKKRFVILFVCFCFGNIFGQDSVTKISPNSKLKVGVYVTEKEFLERTPSITTPFKILPHYFIKNNIDSNRIDSLNAGVIYQFLDSTPIPKNAFGLFDGNIMYWGDNKTGYYKIDYVGRFSYSLMRNPKTRISFSFGLISAIVSAADRLLADPSSSVYFYNKKGKFLEATGQAIGWLLKDDKDFLQEFNAEKKYTNEVFIKYLQKMNERYPE